MKPHATDLLALSFGLIFVGFAILWLVHRFGTVSAVGVAVLVAVGVIGLLGFGLVRAIGTPRRREPDRDRR